MNFDSFSVRREKISKDFPSIVNNFRILDYPTTLIFNGFPYEYRKSFERMMIFTSSFNSKKKGEMKWQEVDK